MGRNNTAKQDTAAIREALNREASRWLSREARVNCTQVLDALAPLAYSLCGDTDQNSGKEELLKHTDNWAMHCYRTLLATAFPENADQITEGEITGPDADPMYPAVIACLDALQMLLDQERKIFTHNEFIDFDFLSQEEALKYDCGKEYVRFLEVWKKDYIYEMLRLCDELMPYTTLAHIASVHHVALLAARGLEKAGCKVDVSLVSASAAVHDIGKFGCRKGERVPYLHYYYTSVWCDNKNLHNTGEIASNHSTWDLELENLPAESLCLIYADFRSKDKRVDGKNQTVIFSLKESFDVILSKLDNVDDVKKRRYRLVYSRLRDLEDLLVSEGVDVNGYGIPIIKRRQVDVNVQTSEELVSSLIFAAIRSNIDMLHDLTSEKGFVNILEKARTEKDWKHLRAYLEILSEFSMYLGRLQKKRLVDFLYELLSHREGDIRREAASVLGKVIAQFNSGYRKEIPADAEDVSHRELLEIWNDTLSRIITPDYKYTARHISRIGYTLKLVFQSLYENAYETDCRALLNAVFVRYENPDIYNGNEAFVLLDTLSEIPVRIMDRADIRKVFDFALHYYKSDEIRLRVAAGRFLVRIAFILGKDDELTKEAYDLVKSIASDREQTTAERYLRLRVIENSGKEDKELRESLLSEEIRREIFLDDLKADTHWIIIAINVKYLLYCAKHSEGSSNLQIATHLCNLLKVSEYVGVRQEAGNALLAITPSLSPDQKNEVAIELLKALETGDYTFSKYIPPYLGRLSMQLPMEQKKELLSALKSDISSVYISVVSVALDTIWCMLSESAKISEEGIKELQEKMLGVILTGIAHYEPDAFQNSLLLFGKLFAESLFDDSEKNRLLGLTLQKFMPLMNQAVRATSGTDLTKYYSTAALSHLWRFITEYQVDRGKMMLPMYDKVAFFPGTFDPFTLSHKGIVDVMQDEGFEVYLAVDEFSWSKNTQPHLLRRQIVSMSVAEQFHVHIFPDDIPVNLANAEDLDKLEELFRGRKVYIVMGSDVVKNASAYKQPPTPGCIRERNHIIFQRGEEDPDAPPLDTSSIEGEVVILNLPSHLEHVSSNRIRENVDNNRDISSFTEPLVQEFIYKRGLYLHEARYKAVQRYSNASFDHIAESGVDYIRLYDDIQGGSPIAWLKMRILETSKLLSAGLSLEMASLIRETAHGKVMLIEDMRMPSDISLDDPVHMLFTEGILYGIRKGCLYGVYYNPQTSPGDEIIDSLNRQGFLEQKCISSRGEEKFYLCDLREPLLLMQNVETTIKSPFDESNRMHECIQSIQKNLQSAMTKLYPGHLVISLSGSYMLQRLMERITELNGVPAQPVEPRVLGPYMAVPFGKILRGRTVPNTVTKTLRTDRVFTPDLKNFTIEPFPGYTSLSSQMRVIHSFKRPIILVDDILNKSGRLKGMIPLLKEEGVNIQQVLVGILTDYGQDDMHDTGLNVEGIYRIPSIRTWLLESTLYPFIGGDSVSRNTRGSGALMPAVNRVYPYVSPEMTGAVPGSEYIFSKTVLESARDIFVLLEQLYREHYGRKLTINRLNEAIVLPVSPDRGKCLRYDEGLSPSACIENDLELLARTFL